jgi:tetratricopeptide (TPR) repeat protein
MLVLAALILELQVEIDVLKDDFSRSAARPFEPPRAGWVRAAALGCHTLVADVYWLRAIQYREDMADRGEFPRDLYPMGEFITDLDSRYHLVYFFTGLNLMMEGGDSDQIISILEKGDKSCPDYWKTPFLLGFYYFAVLQDFDKAADHMETAYKINRHWLYGRLASRLRLHGGSPEVGIQFLREMIKQIDDERNIRLFERRIKELETQILERDLTKTAERYHRARGEYPFGLDDIVDTGLLKKIPPHPLQGHRFIYDRETNAVVSEPRIDLDLHDSWASRRGKKRTGSKARGGKK